MGKSSGDSSLRGGGQLFFLAAETIAGKSEFSSLMNYTLKDNL
jgi:hypothetical protein